MNDCPSESEWRAFTAESLSADRMQWMCAHVDRCASCRQILDEMSHGDAFARTPTTDADGFLQSLAEMDPGRLFDTSWREVLDPPVADDEIGRLGGYAVLSEIGSGGMGIVFRARDTTLNRLVAVKTIRPSISVQVNQKAKHGLMNRFRREARMASSLNHPNVVTIYEIGEHNGLAYIVMEFIQGCSLREKAKSTTLSMPERLGIAGQVIEALVAAHDSGMVHRDLKPDNVMIRDDGLVKVLDFGLARPTAEEFLQFTDSFSAVGSVMGTFKYMSPEQARGETLETSSDVFSFGILLYSLLTGEHPFASGTRTEVLAAILDRAPRPFGDSAIPMGLQQLILRCLSKDPHQRPSAARIRVELQKYQDATLWNDGDREAADQAGVDQAGVDQAGVDQTEQMGKGVDRKTEPAHDRPPSESTLRANFGGEITRPVEMTGRPVRYAQSGDVNIAWQAIGEGPIDIVFVMGWVSHLDWFWKDPSFAAFLNRLSEFGRVILFDKRGTGLSDKVPINELPTLEDRMDDVRAVMDAAGCDKAVLFGVSEGGPMSALFAATYPDKTIALIMNGSYARRLWADDYPWGPTAEAREKFLQEIRDHWGGPIGLEDRAPSKADDPAFRSWWANYLRMGASPGAAVALTKMNAEIDIRGVLPNIQTPTLVIHRKDDRCLLLEEGRYLADAIPGAKFVELPGADHLPFVGDSNAILEEIEEFLTGKRHAPDVDRVLATVLSIVVEHAAQWETLQRQVECQADLFRGENLQRSGNVLHLTFDGPVRAVRAAQSLLQIGLRLSVKARYGVATGICEISRDRIQGPAVEHSTTIAEQAPLASVWVSEDVQNLTSGSGLEFVSVSGFANNTGSEASLHQLVV